MIYLVPSNMTSVFSLQAFSMESNPVFVRDIIGKNEGVISFEDNEYESLKGTIVYLKLDAKFVTGFPGQKVPAVYLTETDSSLFINFDETELKDSPNIKVSDSVSDEPEYD